MRPVFWTPCYKLENTTILTIYFTTKTFYLVSQKIEAQLSNKLHNLATINEASNNFTFHFFINDIFPQKKKNNL